ncbi:MAG: FMN-dependent NADH-azoreductase [Proteobacteria bacterium]|nr:MAG: FMN-dependent NADH-azoreductase [Pseudomonadota bacterium]
MSNPNQKQPTPRALHVLRVESSARASASTTRALAGELIDALGDAYGAVKVTTRDVSGTMPFVDSAWVEANATDPGERTDLHRAALAYSDTLVRELEAADIVVIGVPVYNFGIPASLKAWIDMVARARRTFRYTENGPVGMLTGKKAYLVVASGGVAIDSATDFATPYMRHILSFVGITDVEVIGAARQNLAGESAVEAARSAIAAEFGYSDATMRAAV